MTVAAKQTLALDEATAAYQRLVANVERVISGSTSAVRAAATPLM